MSIAAQKRASIRTLRTSSSNSATESPSGYGDAENITLGAGGGGLAVITASRCAMPAAPFSLRASLARPSRNVSWLSLGGFPRDMVRLENPLFYWF